MAEETLTQQEISTLQEIYELADADLPPDRIKEIWNQEQENISSLLHDKSQIDTHTEKRLATITQKGIDALDVDSLHELQWDMHRALIIKKSRLTETHTKEGKQSRPNLGFAESINSINNKYRGLHNDRRKIQDEYIGKLVLQYGKQLRLNRNEVEALRKEFISQIERTGYSKPLDPRAYVRTLDTIASSATYIPDYQKQKALLIHSGTTKRTPAMQEQDVYQAVYENSPELKRLYTEVSDLTRRELTYLTLKREVVEKEAYVSVRPDIAYISVAPYVTLEAATHIALLEHPNDTPRQLIYERAVPMARAFVGYHALGYQESVDDTVEGISEIISLRKGHIAAKEARDYLESIKHETNARELLYEFQRADIQTSLLSLLDNPPLLENMFSSLNDQQHTKEAFKGLVTSPIFSYLQDSIKQQVTNQSHGPGLSGLLRVASDSVGVLSTPEKNPAMFFLITADRLATLKENPELYSRFTSLFQDSSQQFPFPSNAQQSFLALALLTSDPGRPINLHHLRSLAIESGFHNTSHSNHTLFLFLEKLIGFNTKLPKKMTSFRETLTTKLYLTYLLGINQNTSFEALRGFKDFFPVNIGVGLPALSSFSLPSALSMGANTGLRGLFGLAGGAPGFLLSGASSLLGNTINMFTGGVPLLGEASNSNNLLLYALIPVFVIFFFFSTGFASPITNQQKVMPVFLDEGGRGSMVPSDDLGVDCTTNPSSPLCQFEQCTEKNGRSCLSPSCGCLTQGVNGNYSHVGYNAIDIGIGGGGKSGTCNGELNPIVTTPVSGTVLFVGWGNEYGNVVVIQSLDGFQLLFAHLASFAVSKNQTITAGKPVGRMNNTGNSSGTHLHFERRDPSGFLAVNPAMAAVGVYRHGLPTSPEQNIRSMLPSGVCF